MIHCKNCGYPLRDLYCGHCGQKADPEKINFLSGGNYFIL